MSRALEWINTASGVWWQYVVHTSWQSAAAGLLLLAIVHLAGPRWPAPLRCALLVLALLKFACPPLLPAPTGLFSQFALPETILSARAERKPMQTTEPRARDGVFRAEAGGHASLAAKRGELTGRLLEFVQGLTWPSWLMLLHAAGAGVIAGGISKEARRLRRLARSSVRRLNPVLGRQYRDLAIQLGVYRIPALTICERAEAPMAFGWKRASIILPAQVVRRLSPTELKAVLAHELAHCKRGDLWLVWIQVTLFALWWFHPVVWLVTRSLSQAREDCCDDLVLARGFISNDAYCDLLLRAASSSVTPRTALAFGTQLHPLARRMARITDWTLARCERVSKVGAVAVLVFAAVLLPGARSTPSGIERPASAGAAPAAQQSGTGKAGDSVREAVQLAPMQIERRAVQGAARREAPVRKPARPVARGSVAHETYETHETHETYATRATRAAPGKFVVRASDVLQAPRSAVQARLVLLGPPPWLRAGYAVELPPASGMARNSPAPGAPFNPTLVVRSGARNRPYW